MFRASVKNTFLDFVESEQALPAGRAKSTDPAVGRRSLISGEDGEEFRAAIDHLNVFINVRVAPQPIQSIQPRDTGVGAETTAPQDKPGAPSVSELRQLQRRLSELTGFRCPNAAPHTPPSASPLTSPVHLRMRSSSFMSTVDISDADEGFDNSCMKQAWSSASVSTMVSDLCNEDYDDRGVSRSTLTSQGLSVTMLKPTRTPASRQCILKDLSHCRVPRSVNLAEEFSKADQEAPPTTIMIRNIPNRYTQREFIKELERLDFKGTFDFLYLPIDKSTLCNVGYSFVNFIDHACAARCMQALESYTFRKHRKARGKIATVSVAHIQGLEANVRHYEKAAVNGINHSRQRGPIIMPHIADSLDASAS